MAPKVMEMQFLNLKTMEPLESADYEGNRIRIAKMTKNPQHIKCIKENKKE